MKECQYLKKYFFAFVDNELDVPKNIEILDHLNICPDCTEKIEQERAFNKLLKNTILYIPTPESVRKNIHAVIDKKSSHHVTLPFNNPIIGTLLLAACLVLGISLVTAFLKIRNLSTLYAYRPPIAESVKIFQNLRNQSFGVQPVNLGKITDQFPYQVPSEIKCDAGHFRLVGGNRISEDNEGMPSGSPFGNAAFLVYRCTDNPNMALTVFVFDGKHDGRLSLPGEATLVQNRHIERGIYNEGGNSYNLAHWNDRTSNSSIVLVSDIDQNKMENLAQNVMLALDK